MPFAFAAATLPWLDVPGVAALAAAVGQAVELPASRDPRRSVAANLSFTRPANVRRAFADTGARLACVAFAVPAGGDTVAEAELVRVIAAAAEAGSPLVRLVEIRPTAVPVLRGAADVAASVGVYLVLQNGSTRGGVVELWRRVDAVDRPAVGCCLDAGRAAAAGDGPSVSVPMLGSRIALVRLRPGGAYVAEVVHRLAGIGYAGPLLLDLNVPPQPADPAPLLTAAAGAVDPWLPAGTARE